jgi:hypothetical protein
MHSPLIVPTRDASESLEIKAIAGVRSSRWARALTLGATLAAVMVTMRVALALGLGSGGMGSPDVGDAVFLLAVAAAQTTLGLLFRRDAERLLRERLLGTWHGRAAVGLAAMVPVLAIALGDCAVSALFLTLTQS